MTKHTLIDGTEVTLGLRVKDYDAKYGVIIDDGPIGEMNAEELKIEHVPGDRVTCNAWFKVRRDDGTVGSFDCSRMIAEGGRYDR